MLKVNGFLAPPGLWFGRFSCWFFTSGFSTVSAVQDQLRLKASSNLEGEGQMSNKDFNKLLSSDVCAKPKITNEAIKMLETVAMAAEKLQLAGDHPCIASINYKYAAKLMEVWARSIADNMNRPSLDEFLVKILHKVNQEIQLAIMAIYDQLCCAQDAAFVINPTIVTTMFVELKKIFDQIVRYQVSDFLLPVSLDTTPSQENQNDNEQAPTGRVTKKQKRLEKNDNTSTN